MQAVSMLIPDWNVSSNVVAAQTTRRGGVSGAAYSELNMAEHVGDSKAAVRQNRQAIAEQTGADIQWQWLQQVHGNEVVVIESKRKPLIADALVTRTTGVACCVLTADCLPVFIAAKNGSEVAIVHAGWRGMASGIIENTIRTLVTPAADVAVWLGPAIGPCHFEVGEEVKQLFSSAAGASQSDSEIAGCFQASEHSGKYMADLFQLARIKLHRLGINHISGGGLCTYCQPELFYSYRRENPTGRMLSMIYLKASNR